MEKITRAMLEHEVLRLANLLGIPYLDTDSGNRPEGAVKLDYWGSGGGYCLTFVDGKGEAKLRGVGRRSKRQFYEMLNMATTLLERQELKAGPVIRWVVIGRRWGDGNNTYHSVRIYNARNGNYVAGSDFTYGYGEAYKKTAFDLLCDLGEYNSDNREDYVKFTFSRSTGEGNIFQVADVARRKDL
jgi:hypothetical protein